MAAAALPLALSPLGGGEGGGDTNNTPPQLAERKKASSAWGVSVAPFQHVRTGLPSLGRLAPQTFHFLCAEHPPSPSGGCTSPHSLFIHPPLQLRSPPLPAPPPHSPAPPMLAQPEPPPPHPARGAGGCSLNPPPDPDQYDPSDKPANQLQRPLRCPPRV